MFKMFLDHQWNISGLQKLIRKIDETGSADQSPESPGSGRQCTARSAMKVKEVQELAPSQEGKPQSHCTE